jgi:membrane AbrB-like protein
VPSSDKSICDRPARAPGRLAALSRAAQWALLALASLVLVSAFEAISLPAAVLIGSMLTAIAFGTGGFTIAVPSVGFAASQAVLGTLIAASIRIEVIGYIAEDWPAVLIAVVSTVAASSFLGWSISRLRILPGTTAVWGAAPGAATAMVLMAATFGADARLVAFMQYLRVVMVTIAAALVARLWVDTSGVSVAAPAWFPALSPAGFGATLAVALAGGVGGHLVRLPSPFFLGAFILGVALNLGGGLSFQHPPWLLAASYALIGWTIGLRFDRAVVRQAARAMPQIMLSIVILMAFCGAIAWLLAAELGIDPLTAYLATSPGGMDSIAIIAAASPGVDLSMIMTLQTARFLFVLVCGPALARLVARSLRS